MIQPMILRRLVVAPALCIIALSIAGCSGTDVGLGALALNGVMQVEVQGSGGAPAAGQTVYFTANIYNNAGGAAGTELTGTRTTDQSGQCTFLASYNLDSKKYLRFQYHVAGGSTQASTITWVEAQAQAGGTGSALITKYDTIRLPGT